MPRLEAEVTANIGPFERALKEAAGKAKEFAEQTKDVGKDVFKEGAGDKAAGMLGFAGAAGAATAFGAAVVETAKQGLEAFGHMEQQVLQLKYNLQDPSTAKEVHEWIRQIALGADDVDKLQSAFVSLSESGESLEASKEILQDLQAVALKSGTSVDELAEAFRRAKAGGLDAGEGAAKLLKSIPGLSVAIEKLKNEQAELVHEEVGVWDPNRGVYTQIAQAGEQAKALREMSVADYVKKGFLKTEDLTAMLHGMAPRGMVAEERKTLVGTESELGKAIDEAKEKLGEGLAPAIKALTQDIAENLPSIETNLKDFGTALGNAVGIFENTIKDFASTKERIEHPTTEIGKKIKGVDEFFQGVEKNIADWFMHGPTAKEMFAPLTNAPETPVLGESIVTDINDSLKEGNNLQEKTNSILESLVGFE